MRLAGPHLTALLLLVPLMAGCADAGPAAAAPTSAIAGPENGALEVLALNDEQMPVANAKVLVRSTTSSENRTATTQEDGRAAMSNLAPGPYDLAIEAVFYATKTLKVDILAAEVTRTTLTLEDVVKEQPFVEAVPKKGFINCSTAPFPAYGTYNFCEPLGRDQAKFDILFKEGAAIRAVIAEVKWQPTTPATGTELEVAICNKSTALRAGNCADTQGGDFYRRAGRGPSPVTVGATDLPLARFKEYMISVGDGGTTGARAAVTLQQSFDVWISVCYVQPCAANYTALPK